VLLIIAGVAIGRKVRPDSLAELRTMDRQRLAVLSFAICVVSSGVFCFILEREWLSLLSTAVKIPMYMVLGTSSCFAISFSVIDTVNTGCCTPDEADGGERLSRAIVSSPSQIYSILVGSVAMGAVFGFMFGYLDVEDDDWKLVRFSTDQVARVLCCVACVCRSSAAPDVFAQRGHCRGRSAGSLEPNSGREGNECGGRVRRNRAR
jgi:hypothetical protein